ncbi:hypothetical protein ALMP_26450 [Streptomyces sp. A012304]|nr:hypothetical protein ALMP_26450 [Streptomyces sp. A012304]
MHAVRPYDRGRTGSAARGSRTGRVEGRDRGRPATEPRRHVGRRLTAVNSVAATAPSSVVMVLGFLLGTPLLVQLLLWFNIGAVRPTPCPAGEGDRARDGVTGRRGSGDRPPQVRHRFPAAGCCYPLTRGSRRSRDDQGPRAAARSS